MKTFFAWFRAVAGVVLVVWGLRWVLVGLAQSSTMARRTASTASGWGGVVALASK